jgi:hypothetical protein
VDHIEDRASLVGDQVMRPQRPRHQGDGLLDLLEPAFGQPALVERETPQQVLPQGPGRPDAELGPAPGVDAVADREDHVEVVEVDLALDLSDTLPLNCCISCNSCGGIELSRGEDPTQVPGDDGLVPLEQLGDLVQGQPDRLPLQAHVHPHLAILGLEDDDLSAGRVLPRDRRPGLVHRPVRAPAPSHAASTLGPRPGGRRPGGPERPDPVGAARKAFHAPGRAVRPDSR